MRRISLFHPLCCAPAFWPTTPAVQAAQKSLVFCSEGSPAGFDIAQYTSATDNDAAEPMYNRLVEFEKGATNVVPALANKLGYLRGRSQVHVSSA